MFHFHSVCFGMISCDCNTAFTIHLLICLYNSLWFSWCWCYALTMNVFHSAFPMHRIIFFLSTITWKFWIFHWLEYVLIVAAYYLRNIFCATITYLTNLGLNILRNLLFFGKCLSKSFKKISATFVTTLLL